MGSFRAVACSHNPARKPVARPSTRTPPKAISRLGGFVALGFGLALVGTAALSKYEQGTYLPSQVMLHGAPGVKVTTKGNEVRWRKAQTTVYIDASVDKLGPTARDSIQRAFATWMESDAKLPQVAFDVSTGAVASTKPDGKNTVLFAPITVPGHERDLAITLTYSDDKTGDILESDVVINANFPFDLLAPKASSSSPAGSSVAAEPPTSPADTSAPKVHSARGEDVTTDAEGGAAEHGSDRAERRQDQRSSCVAQDAKSSCGRDVYDVQNVMTHEVGHFFGLGEDMDDTSATMYACTNRCETHKRVLGTEDVAVLSALYASPGEEPEATAAQGCALSGANPGSPTGALAALFAGLGLLAARRKR